MGLRTAVVGTRSGFLADQVVDAGRTPLAVAIPSIDVEAWTVPVGVEGDGSFDVPDAADVGWYEHGPAPGDPGSAVLAGHVDYAGQRGVFWDLDVVERGSTVDVLYDDGTRAEFVVTDVGRFPRDELPSDLLFARDGAPRLALITCGGDFDAEARSYDDNIVVIAKPA